MNITAWLNSYVLFLFSKACMSEGEDIIPGAWPIELKSAILFRQSCLQRRLQIILFEEPSIVLKRFYVGAKGREYLPMAIGIGNAIH